MAYGLIVVYNTDKYGANPPKSWADFFDTTRFPGKRGIQNISGDLDPGMFEGALLADGVAPEAVYPIDTDRALAKFSSIRDDIVFWTSGAQSQQQIEAGQVDMALVWSGRAYSAVKNGRRSHPCGISGCPWLTPSPCRWAPRTRRHPWRSLTTTSAPSSRRGWPS